MRHDGSAKAWPNGGIPMTDDKTLRNIYRMLATGGPPQTVDDAIQRTAAVIARRRRLARQFGIPAAVAATAILVTLGGPLIKSLLRSEVSPPLVSSPGCEGATPRIYPTSSARTDLEQQGNSSAFMPTGAEADVALASFGCDQQRENP
jgi:hypothetical protein